MIEFIVFLYGLIVGSFLNVCIYRIPSKQSIVKPGSYCPKCNTPIKLYDNIPIISFFLLRRKCRNCQAVISFRYPAVELTTGLLFLATYLLIGQSWALIAALTFISLLIVIFLIDVDYQIIPNGLVIFGLIVGLIFLIIGLFKGGFPLVETALNPAISAIGSGLGVSAFLLLIAFVAEAILKKEAMGGGDIKLAVVLGMFLGPYVFLALFLSFFVGSFVSVFLMSTGIVKKGEPIAFGPFMAVGAVLTLYFGPQIFGWYLSFLI